VIKIIWLGEWVSSKKPPSVVFPPSGEPSRNFPQQRARVLFGDQFASIKWERGARTRARASKRVYRIVFLIPYLRRSHMAWGWAWRYANQSSKGTAAAFGRCLDPPMVPSFNSLCRHWTAVPEMVTTSTWGDPSDRYPPPSQSALSQTLPEVKIN
jgi:hypothetical protein